VPAKDLSTFTVGFTERSHDESEAAAALAAAFGTRHHVSRLDLNAAYALTTEVVGRLDEPLADPSLIPTYLLCRFARQSVTVALSGDGGDELFAGYDPFLALAPAKAYSRLVPPPVHRVIRRVADYVPHRSGYMTWDFRLRRALSGLSYAPRYWNPVWMAPIEPRAMAQYFDDPLPIEELYEEAIAVWQSCESTDTLSRALEYFTTIYLQNDILTKVDRASMMVALESRAVFLEVQTWDAQVPAATCPRGHRPRRRTHTAETGFQSARADVAVTFPSSGALRRRTCGGFARGRVSRPMGSAPCRRRRRTAAPLDVDGASGLAGWC
jgi:asparagine synthase (glutamine-hydrolysing)